MSRVLQRQSLLDMAIQEGGTLQILMELAQANNLSITDELSPGEEIQFSGKGDKKVVDIYRKNGYKPASSITIEDIDIDVQMKIFDETFDENGRKTAQIIESATDNSRSEQYWSYYADGRVASLIGKLTNSTYPQGYYKEEQYYQSGAVSMSHELSQYGDNKYYYDANGNKTKYEGKNNLGERVEIVYHADGSHTDTIHEASGKTRVETWGADGSLTVTYLP